MLNLKIFTLFVLAGLCFGASLEGHQSSGDNSQDSDPRAEPQPSAQAEESNKGEASPSGSGDSDSEKKEESTDAISENNGEKKETEGSDSKGKGAGEGLPDFLGDLSKRREYALQLLSACSTEHSYFKINEKNIMFQNCTYFCLSESGRLPPKENRIPKGMVCNKNNDTCPEKGDCPPLPLPSC
uniref:Putative ixodes 8-cys protein n=1 Tax=Ixodes ricinus TaxID=34613 RepID=A0A0K8RMM5_IXORI